MKKVILITGASAGIGKETAKLLLKDGHTVYAAARRLDKMNDLKQLGVKTMKVDVTVDADMVSAVNTIITAEGRIDVLVNNAGFGSYGAIEDVPLEDARYQFDVNIFGLARLTQLVLPHMRAQHDGVIINISSIGGKITTPLGGWYHATKFALEGLSDTLRNEVRQFGIKVVVIEPGGIKTEWGGIAADSMVRISGHTAYADTVNKLMKLLKGAEDKGSDPIVIADLIKKAIEAKNPKARYSGGYFAGLALFSRKILSDKLFDKFAASQMK